MDRGFTGISFPFRFSGRGGISTSTTSPFDSTHIDESIEQLIKTSIGERLMELSIGGEVQSNLFDLDDLRTQATICLLVKECLEQEKRIEVVDVSARAEDLGTGNALILDIQYNILKYRTEVTKKIVLKEKEGDR